MGKKTLFIIAVLTALTTSYLLLKPNEVTPIAWQAPLNPDYTAAFEKNNILSGVELMSIGKEVGPEDIVISSDGWLYASVHDGKIIRMRPDGSDFSVYAKGLGRPLGLALNKDGDLIVADAYKGLLKVNHLGEAEVLAEKVTDKKVSRPIVYANNVAIASNGWVYFTEASYKFGAKRFGGSYPASLLDLMEHGPYGSVLLYKPEYKTVEILYQGFHFANGLVLSHDEKSLLMAETGSYRIVKLSLVGDKKVEELLVELPAFPDNITQGLEGKYWVGLVSPRNKMLDAMSNKPLLRNMVQNLPKFVRPKATYYGHVVAFDDEGKVLHSFQDESGKYPTNTSVFETSDYLYIGSLTANKMARLKVKQ